MRCLSTYFYFYIYIWGCEGHHTTLQSIVEFGLLILHIFFLTNNFSSDFLTLTFIVFLLSNPD